MGLADHMRKQNGGRLAGLYRGIVTNVNDPEGLGRIRAKVHELLGDEAETNWASYCSPFGGEGAGWFFLPKTNDGVWIMFEAGDINRPVWCGYWFNKTDAPPDGAAQDVRVLRSKSGHRIEFGDVDGSEFVRLKHQNGSTIEMDAGGNIVITDAGANVKIGSGTLQRLVNETLTDLFNSHTHAYQNGVPSEGWATPPALQTNVPDQQMDDSHLTEETITS